MQERITRINLAVEPPDVLIQPRLGALKMMDFDQVGLAIEEGYIGVKEKMEAIKALLEMPGQRSEMESYCNGRPCQQAFQPTPPIE